MKRHCWLASVMVFLLVASSVAAQGTNENGERGAGQAGSAPARPPVAWNTKMPWGPMEAAVRMQWAGLPLTEEKVEPFKVFDNVYYVGVQVVGSYLITTSEGLILIDATYAETGDMVLDSIRKLGFDPANVKYLIISHQHFDHFGGAGRVQQVTHARVGMSEIDWAGVERQQSNPLPGQNPGVPLERDLIIKDGDTLKLGDTTLKFYVTPGHTPGALAIEIPARAGGKTYRALSPCTGINAATDLTKPYIESMERLKKMGPWDTLLPNHAFLMPRDPAIAPSDFIFQNGKSPKESYPGVIGPERIDEWFDEILKVANEKLVSEKK
jgi:glyoxylase-like metal-dependent hydrolase (beta-lactamase superfamily II)